MNQQKEGYYYGRDTENKPRVTVCILRNSIGEIARGVAICSRLDNPNKKIGKAIARGRAEKAMNQEKSTDVIDRSEARNIMGFCLTNYHNQIIRKSAYNPALIDIERKILS